MTHQNTNACKWNEAGTVDSLVNAHKIVDEACSLLHECEGADEYTNPMAVMVSAYKQFDQTLLSNPFLKEIVNLSRTKLADLKGQPLYRAAEEAGSSWYTDKSYAEMFYWDYESDRDSGPIEELTITDEVIKRAIYYEGAMGNFKKLFSIISISRFFFRNHGKVILKPTNLQ